MRRYAGAVLLLICIVENSCTAPFKNLTDAASRAAAIVASSQQGPGYWLTSYTGSPRFKQPAREMNTYLTAVMIDVLGPISGQARLGDNLDRARKHLTGQIEDTGLVRYHGKPEGPASHGLGCVISPDADDTALVWRIAPAADPQLMEKALATLAEYRSSDQLYLTWLAPRDSFQCIDPGKDPDPADVAIQMHILMFLAQVRPANGWLLCKALDKAIDDDRIWVYYKIAPLIPILRLVDLKAAGCSISLPPARLKSNVAGQDIWNRAGLLLSRLLGSNSAVPSSTETNELLQKLAQDDFAAIRQNPPLLYHNDLTASTPRFYWSADFGYALWLRLYFANLRLNQPPILQ